MGGGAAIPYLLPLSRSAHEIEVLLFFSRFRTYAYTLFCNNFEQTLTPQPFCFDFHKDILLILWNEFEMKMYIQLLWFGRFTDESVYYNGSGTSRLRMTVIQFHVATLLMLYLLFNSIKIFTKSIFTRLSILLHHNHYQDASMYNPNVYFHITVIILPHHKLIERIHGSHIVQSMMFSLSDIKSNSTRDMHTRTKRRQLHGPSDTRQL